MQTIYFSLNLIALLIVVVLGTLTFHNKRESYANAFLFAMISMGIWTIASGVELMAHSFEIKLLARNVTQVMMALVAISTYWFVVQYASYKNRIFRLLRQILNFLTLIYTFVLFTDQRHHLLRTEAKLVSADGWDELVIKSTLLGTISVLYRFVIFGFATILLFAFFVKTYKNMKKQVIMISTGFVLALVLLLLKQYWLIDLGIHVPMSVILILPYLLIGIGIFRYDFLTVTPFAKEWIINSLEDGILMVSNDGFIVEKNNAAEEILRVHHDQIDYGCFEERLKGVQDFIEEVEIEMNMDYKYYQVKGHHLFTDNNQKRGSVVVIKDITIQKKQEKALIHKADYDGLTHVLNKQAIEKEYVFLKKGPISMLVIDIDHFKQVNDTHGHQVGDEVLVGIVSAMKQSVRKQDLLGRIGGDEFCIVMTACDKELCLKVSERILEMIRKQQYNTGVQLDPVTVSIGGLSNIELRSLGFEKMFAKADEALYEAKEKGRNQAVIK